jgi:hypothetical protein
VGLGKVLRQISGREFCEGVSARHVMRLSSTDLLDFWVKLEDPGILAEFEVEMRITSPWKSRP